jgi:hypothetical protein
MTTVIEQLNAIKAKFQKFQAGEICTTELTEAAR